MNLGKAGLALVLSAALPAAAQAITVNFDSLSGEAKIPNGYGGLNWSSGFFSFEPDLLYSGSGYNNGTVSPKRVAFNAFASPVSFTEGAFNFESAYLTAAWNTGLNVLVEGLRNNTILYARLVTVDTTGPTLFNFNFLGVDTVTLFSFGGTNAGLGFSGTHFVLDDVTYTGVPEPSTLILLGGGLLAAGLRFRQRRH